MNERTFANIIGFWRNVEALSPQEIPKLAANDKVEPVHDWEGNGHPPWTDTVFKRRSIPSGRAWRHSVYAATYDRAEFIDCLEAKLGKQPNVFEERPGGKSCVFSLAFDEYGNPLVETFMLSMAAWAFGIIYTTGLNALGSNSACNTEGLHAPTGELELPPSNSGLPGFDRQFDSLREELAWRVGSLSNGETINKDWFDEFTHLVVSKCSLNTLTTNGLSHRIKSVQVRKPRQNDVENKQKADDDFLNSFFIKDLNRLAAAKFGGSGDAIRRYLGSAHHRTRIDVRRERIKALEQLQPKRFPEGCWPAEHPLVWSQQVAINSIMSELGQNGGTFAVNGPPGTGKTTLLRDVVAAIVVDRAKVLAEYGSALLGDKCAIDIGGRSVPYYGLGQQLAKFSIVVASSNNGAVENISLELPKLSAIDPKWRGAVDVYSDIATEILGEQAWAMVAGRLGNKSNRSEFVNRFWWQRSDENKQNSGLRERLDAIIQGRTTPALSWNEAVARFKKARSEEHRIRQQLVKLQEIPTTLAKLYSDKVIVHQDEAIARDHELTCHKQLDDLGTRLADSEDVITRKHSRFKTLKEARPSVLEWISTFGRSHRVWREELHNAISELHSAEDNQAELKREIVNIKARLDRVLQQISDIDRRLNTLLGKIANVEMELAAGRERLGKYWPDLTMSDHNQERSSPWAYDEWRTARISVFVAAMNLHRSFVETNARKMMANLGVAMDMLGGGIPDPKTRAIALESLAIVCPVISTTFASVATLFGDLGAETIGWLLIDEAGQAAPQAAAGAIWRARRAVVVGDPLQLEPVVTIPRTVESALAACSGGVELRLHPSRTSVQVLADQATIIGTTVGEGEDALWVGAPLRVHRRCDNPMFSVSNEVAYGGLMVHQKKQSSFTWPVSAWINVPRSASDGNWIPAEGEALKDLLRKLIEDHAVPAGDIFLISPFRQVVRQLRTIGRIFGLDPRRVGTVHTTQGKEADVVILVLGGGTVGSRDWAASKPNLLNVAASRAKARLYVVGERNDWARRRFFDVLVKHLPAFQLAPV